MGRFLSGLLIALLASPAAGAEEPLLRAGFTEWVLAGGYGSSVSVGPTNPGVQFLSFTPQWGRVLRPGIEYVLEGHLSRYFDPGGALVGILPVGFRIHTGGERLLPYLSLGAGLGYTNLQELEEIDRKLNFLLQVGFGVRWRAREQRYFLLEGRIHHLSNGATAGRNLGINSALVLVGYGFG